MVEPTGRTIICSVVFIDIVRYSESSIGQQLAWKARLNEAIAGAVGDLAENDRIILDTGDGAAICFLGDPEDALFAATAINKALGEAGGPTVRTGINLGPVKRVVDLNGRTNVLGDGINVAQRIMSFSDHGEILVSRSYYEVVARLTEGNERLFRYMGIKRDKHIREHQLYAFSFHGDTTEGVEQGSTADAPAPVRPYQLAPAGAEDAAVHALARLAPAYVAAEERRLAHYLGPLAKVMTARAAEHARTPAELTRKLAVLIADPADRAAFLEAAILPAEDPLDEPVVAEPAAPGAAEPAFDPDDLVMIERQLAHHIGPLAKILVQRATRTARNREELVEALAAHIGNQPDRNTFLAALADWW
jgi:hypothetical protein